MTQIRLEESKMPVLSLSRLFVFVTTVPVDVFLGSGDLLSVLHVGKRETLFLLFSKLEVLKFSDHPALPLETKSLSEVIYQLQTRR